MWHWWKLIHKETEVNGAHSARQCDTYLTWAISTLQLHHIFMFPHLWNPTVIRTQEVEQDVYKLEGRWFDTRLSQAACHSIFEQDAEPQVAPNVSVRVYVCECQAKYWNKLGCYMSPGRTPTSTMPPCPDRAKGTHPTLTEPGAGTRDLACREDPQTHITQATTVKRGSSREREGKGKGRAIQPGQQTPSAPTQPLVALPLTSSATSTLPTVLAIWWQYSTHFEES